MLKRNKITHPSKKVICSGNEPIFTYIKPNNNDKLSDMSGLDLQELIWHIENYYLELRKTLGFDNMITFGLELEFEKAITNRICEKLDQYFHHSSWILKYDSSLDNGAEINSPVLKDNNTTWKDLTKVCEIVSENARIGENSGGHIHIGTQVIGDKSESWLNFIKFWSVYENIIYRFAYGEYLVGRPSIQRYAAPVTKDFWQDYIDLKNGNHSIESIIDTISYQKYRAVNFRNVSSTNAFKQRNTIEFRCPNGSLNPIIWQNNVNLFVNLLLYARSTTFDDDIVTRRHEINQDKYSGLSDYNELYLEQALELCDMLFTNNFDKVYFLRQYLKSFQIGTKILEKPKEFTKK